jgi:Beta-lactamase class A
MAAGDGQESPGSGIYQGSLSDRILPLFAKLPGEVSLKIDLPSFRSFPPVAVEQDPARHMFVGSAIKTFVLCESLRQAEADNSNVVQTISQRQLALDESVWSADSATFNPPNLTGLVSERTTLEAMIMHSDNTATDMALKQAGPDKVREFIQWAGLNSTRIPDSTRSFFGYLLGATDYQTFTWAQLQAELHNPIVNPPLNAVWSMKSSAYDMVGYYSWALQGHFFQHPETLNEFRRILSLGDAIWLVPLPLGVSAFVKGGSIDVPGFHALCVPGGMLVGERWAYFCFTINWTAPSETDPETVAAFATAVSGALAMVKDVLAPTG